MKKRSLIILVFIILIITACDQENIKETPEQKVYPSEITASSYLVEERFCHSPINLFDDDNTSAWVEYDKNYGIGETVTFIFNTPIDIFRIKICNGYQSSDILFSDNSRVKDLIFHFFDKDGKLINDKEKVLDDTMDIQSFDFDINNCKKVIIEIKDVYHGNKWKDTCISGLEVYTNTSNKEINEYKGEKGNKKYKENNLILNKIVGCWDFAQSFIWFEQNNTVAAKYFSGDPTGSRKKNGTYKIDDLQKKIIIMWNDGKKEYWYFKDNILIDSEGNKWKAPVK